MATSSVTVTICGGGFPASALKLELPRASAGTSEVAESAAATHTVYLPIITGSNFVTMRLGAQRQEQ